MSLAILLLAVISGLRPSTSQAAVLALLRTRDPRRTLLAFLLTGFTVSVAIGLLLVLVFQGAQTGLGASTFTDVFDLVAGVASLAFAFGYRQGRVSVPRRHRNGGRPSPGATRLAKSLDDPSITAAAITGVATHFPGLVYLVALNAIAAEDPAPGTATIQVTVYNVLWFAVPLAALALAILRPGSAPGYLERATDWARRHEATVVFWTMGLLGGFLVIKGAVGLF
jgi:hypothetical protein